jgi:hypothetical protein
MKLVIVMSKWALNGIAISICIVSSSVLGFAKGEYFRCGEELVRAGETQDEILKKCGRPK